MRWDQEGGEAVKVDLDKKDCEHFRRAEHCPLCISSAHWRAVEVHCAVAEAAPEGPAKQLADELLRDARDAKRGCEILFRFQIGNRGPLAVDLPLGGFQLPTVRR